MRRWIVASASALAVIVSLLTTGLVQAQGTAAPAAPPQTGGRAGRGPAGPPPPANIPLERNDNRHRTFLDIARGSTIELLFVGDSITDGWRNSGQTIWDQHFAPLKAANFGIGGDTTQGVLWRMQNGELDGYKAKLIVLMLGTNNINRNPNDDIVDGDRLIVEEFRKRQPQAKVLILGIFPRGVEPTNPYRASIRDINSKLAKLADNKNVFFMDIGDKFLTSDGTLTPEIMPDALHPNFRGYRIWADAIASRVRQLMR
jgi:lysophospholipase L1-like esterase